MTAAAQHASYDWFAPPVGTHGVDKSHPTVARRSRRKIDIEASLQRTDGERQRSGHRMSASLVVGEHPFAHAQLSRSLRHRQPRTAPPLPQG